MMRRALLAACLLAGCADPAPRAAAPAADPLPPWAETLPSEPGMLFAAGSATRGDREAAVAAARSELASEIEVSVRSERRERQSDAVAADAGGKRVERYESEVRAEAAQRVAQERLPGVMVREMRDARDRTWALVAMDRSAWAAQLRARLAELDRRIATPADEAADAAPAAAAARRWLHLAPLIAEREALAERLRLAAPGEEPAPAPVDTAALRAELARRLGEVGIAITGGGEELSAAAREACAAKGLRLVDEAPQLTLRLAEPSLRLARVGGELRGDGSAAATLAVGGRALAELTVEDRASGLDEDAARRRLVDKLGADLAVALDRNLLSYLARW